MKLLIDLNVVLDVVQRREPFYAASAEVLSQVLQDEVTGFLPGHALTTLHYIVRRHAGGQKADEMVDWALAHLEIIPQDRASFVRARSLGLQDFEDAALTSAAEAADCEQIITRNVADFAGAPIPATTPEEFLAQKKLPDA